MSRLASLLQAMEVSRFSEVVRTAVMLLDKTELSANEIIQIGELALEALKRDPKTQAHKLKILQKLAPAYSEVEKHARAKEVYRELYRTSTSWEDFYGLLQALANIGELEELKQELNNSLDTFFRQKKVLQLNKLVELLRQLGALPKIQDRIEFEIACIEGDTQSIGRRKTYDDSSFDYFLKHAQWEENSEFASRLMDQVMEGSKISRRLMVKKFYDFFLLHGPKEDMLRSLLRYFTNYNSLHIGYFFRENPGLQVEMGDDQWIEKAFRKSTKVRPPKEIDVELDMAEDLFSSKEEGAVGKLKEIKVLETRINFLLKHGGKDEARKLHGELLALDPSNTKFKNDFEQVIKEEVARNAEQLQDYWTQAWATLSEIEALSGQAEQSNEEEMHFSWKQIEHKELLNNYREYAYALILSEEEKSCLNLLDYILEIKPQEFKDISYLKARCFLRLDRVREARAVVESILESCILDQHEIVEFNYLRAETFEIEGNAEEARRAFESVKDLDSDYRLVRMKLSRWEDE